jgi:hypothetical protein
MAFVQVFARDYPTSGLAIGIEPLDLSSEAETFLGLVLRGDPCIDSGTHRLHLSDIIG